MKRVFLYIVFVALPYTNTGLKAESGIPNTAIEDIWGLSGLKDRGLTKQIFDLAYKGYRMLDSKGGLKNPYVLTIADYSQPSNKKRFYVIDLKERRLIYNTYVAHGRNTGELFARYFSNREGSLKSSLGFYITGKPVTGAHTGFSLLLYGMEKEFNDNAYSRNIIMHGADYATEDFISRYGRLGRSLGCPALPPDQVKQVIESIKDGSCLFIYSADADYLGRSKILN